MKQQGILCLCSLILGISTAVLSQEIVEYSMYDEFGDIMLNAPGRLVIKEKKQPVFRFEEDLQSDQDLSKYRYRTDDSTSNYNRNQSKESESDVLTSYKKKSYETNQVWKFRPLDEDKEKKVIKIEDKPVKLFQQAPTYRQPGMTPYMSPYRSPYTSPYMSPYMPMVPMMPLMPGQVYPMMPY